MACKEANGYDLQWVEDPTDDLRCLICLCVARDPQQHPGDIKNPCGKLFCNDCITEYQMHKSTCPNCQRNLTFFPDSRSARDILALKVKCTNLTNSCDWTGELSSLETHQQSCDYTLIPCTNQCTIQGVVAVFLKKDLPNHLANDCPRRQYECPHCQETGEHQERTTTHLDTCAKSKIQCPNTDCQDMIARCDVDTHRSTCSYEPMSCKYAAVGCEEKLQRKDLIEHENNVQLHLQVIANKLIQVTDTHEEISRLQLKIVAKNVLQLTKCAHDLCENVQQLTKDALEVITVNSQLKRSTGLMPCTLKLTNYQQWKNETESFYSPLFYTSHSGYTMCLKVHANGWGAGAGSYVSASAYLMKGDHDDTLTWPFTGRVTIELLNQLEDKNHYKKTITFPASSAASKRVEEGVKNTGLGYSEFIPHTALNYNATTNTQYLKDDTLVFRVSVKVPDHKQWLDCTV